MRSKELKMNLFTAAVGAVTILWIIQPVFWPARTERTSRQEQTVEQKAENPITELKKGRYVSEVTITPEEDFYNSLELMARVVEAEARNQGLEGKRMAVDVILNRVKDEDFPNNIEDVIFQENAFAVIANGRYKQVEVSEETWTAIKLELEEISYPELFYFCSRGFHKYGTPWKKVGDHYFNTK